MPLRFVDGYRTTARVLTFDGLVDSREHLALGLGRPFGADHVERGLGKATQLVRMAACGVTQRVPRHVHLSAANAHYLATKTSRGAHPLDVAYVSARS